jgi:hypothetical protein
MFAMVGNVFYEAPEPLNQLGVRVLNFVHSCRAQVDFEFQVMKRMSPAAHFWVNKSAGVARANPGDMRVMIYQAMAINIFEGAFNQVRSFWIQTIVQLLWLMFEGAADEM